MAVPATVTRYQVMQGLPMDTRDICKKRREQPLIGLLIHVRQRGQRLNHMSISFSQAKYNNGIILKSRDFPLFQIIMSTLIKPCESCWLWVHWNSTLDYNNSTIQSLSAAFCRPAWVVHRGVRQPICLLCWLVLNQQLEDTRTLMFESFSDAVCSCSETCLQEFLQVLSRRDNQVRKGAALMVHRTIDKSKVKRAGILESENHYLLAWCTPFTDNCKLQLVSLWSLAQLPFESLKRVDPFPSCRASF